MKPQTQFNMLTQNRKTAAQASAENKKYIVRAITKAGKYSAAIPHPMNCLDTLDAAKTRLAEMEAMNPGKLFSIQIN
jgi:hypothetical protein